MPNWASTQYVVTGDKKQVRKLYNKMRSIEKKVDRKKGKKYFEYQMWRLIKATGVNPDGICCRGTWSDLDLENNVLKFNTETAWGEMNEWRNYIEEKFDVFFYYYTEEPGCIIYETNDIEGLYFPARYQLYEEIRQDYNYYDTLDELIRDVGKLLGVSGLKTIDDCRKAFDDYSESKQEICYSINEIELADW